jgi:hypothetical protein
MCQDEWHGLAIRLDGTAAAMDSSSVRGCDASLELTKLVAPHVQG